MNSRKFNNLEESLVLRKIVNWVVKTKNSIWWGLKVLYSSIKKQFYILPLQNISVIFVEERDLALFY